MTALVIMSLVVTFAVGLQNTVYLTQLVTSAVATWRAPPATTATTELWARQAPYAYPITIVCPAFNEELSIADSVRALLALNYPDYQLIVVNDGSRDRTMEVLTRAFDLAPAELEPEVVLHRTETLGTWRSRSSPRLTVIDKANGRKADAVNCGLGYARTPLVCVIEADSIIEPDGLLRAAEPFLTDGGELVAVGGAIRIANGCKVRSGQITEVGIARAWLPRFQTVEYLRAFLMSRVAASRWHTLTLISGAFGIFRRTALLAIGGYDHASMGEDLDLVMRLHRHFREKGEPYRIDFVPEIVCWTEAPGTFGGLASQRARWEQGALEVLWGQRAMFGRKRYGRIGAVALPLMLLEDVICPPLELLGWLLIPLLWAFGLLSGELALLFFALSALFGMFLSLGALVHEELQLRRTPSARDLARLTLAALAESFGYRQLNSWHRLKGIVHFFKGRKVWVPVPRAGFVQS